MTGKNRADKVLVSLGHYDSRASAQAAILAGCVEVNGEPVLKASQQISPSDRIVASAPHPWVSRGGVKLAHALDVFEVDPTGRHCLDVGASTGGFTDVLLSRGAKSVVAVDVGRGQLHEKIAGDARVTSLEGTDARALTGDMLGEPPSLIVCDASFIALEKLLGVPLSLAAEEAELVCLFKPQFQVGRAHVGKGGLVSDAVAAARAEEAFCVSLAEQGWRVAGRTGSPIRGGDGNAERLVYGERRID
ncbi:TlyA family RNA methyltransferase [Henriciella sp. AS95]|uniref:TlyA family RNA methyltransferase n=1 Tax=Henriciella sp. AS95 TaxID=3135782 RepID=UPI00316BF726